MTSNPDEKLGAQEVGLSIVRQNILTEPGYTPYCGSGRCLHGWPRTKFNGQQFVCGCGWQSKFEPEFIARIPHAGAKS